MTAADSSGIRKTKRGKQGKAATVLLIAEIEDGSLSRKYAENAFFSAANPGGESSAYAFSIRSRSNLVCAPLRFPTAIPPFSDHICCRTPLRLMLSGRARMPSAASKLEKCIRPSRVNIAGGQGRRPRPTSTCAPHQGAQIGMLWCDEAGQQTSRFAMRQPGRRESLQFAQRRPPAKSLISA
jgi:hypothetical protein